jgi:hypothetical protein
MQGALLVVTLPHCSSLERGECDEKEATMIQLVISSSYLSNDKKFMVPKLTGHKPE